MTRTKKISVFAAVFAVLTVAAGSAFAAQATTSLNVRAWPNGRIVDVLHPGEEVQIVARNGGWCQIEHRGPDGWSACRYLTRSHGGGYHQNNDPDVSFSFGTNGFSFSIGSDSNRRHHWRPWDYRRDNDCIRRWGQWYCPVYY